MFSHGKDSEPWGRKITGLAEIARTEGYDVDSVDYRGIDTPRDRVAKLIEHLPEAVRRSGAGRLEPRRLRHGRGRIAAARARRIPDGARRC